MHIHHSIDRQRITAALGPWHIRRSVKAYTDTQLVTCSSSVTCTLLTWVFHPIMFYLVWCSWQLIWRGPKVWSTKLCSWALTWLCSGDVKLKLFSLYSIDHIHKAAISLWHHTQGGKLNMRDNMFQKSVHSFRCINTLFWRHLSKPGSETHRM